MSGEVRAFDPELVQRGSSALIPYKVAELSDGTPVEIPLIVVRGSQDGPTMWLDALVHGPEMPGYEVVRRIGRELVVGENLRGTLVATPILNPLAFRASTMHTPQDQYNLNRLFPGAENGLLGQRMAYRIFNDLVSVADYVLDLHANPLPALPFTLSMAGSSWAHETTRQMADAAGLTAIEMRLANEAHRFGTLTAAALGAGKPALTIELVGWRRILGYSVEIGVRAVLNVLKSLAMLDGDPELQSTANVIPGALSRVAVTVGSGGIIQFTKQPGDQIATGETIALVRNAYGDVTEEVRTPIDGYLLAYPLIDNQASSTGEEIAFVAYRT